MLRDGTKRIYEAREYFVKVLRELMMMLDKEGDKYSVLSLQQDFNEFYKMMPIKNMEKWGTDDEIRNKEYL